MTKEQKITTLVIHAPRNAKTPFSTIFATGVGPGYIISDSDKSKLILGSTVVVLLSNPQKLRAEGILIKLVKAARTSKGRQRYDVHFKEQHMVTYKYVKLNPFKFGVAVLDCLPSTGKPRKSNEQLLQSRNQLLLLK